MLQAMVNAEKYKEIILSGLVLSIECITEREQEPIFQDDSAASHRARCVSGFVRLCQSDNYLIISDSVLYFDMHPHIITYGECFTVETQQFCEYRSPFLLRTLRHPSGPIRLNLDSSENMTRDHSD